MCKLGTSWEKSNNVGNEHKEMEKVLIGLVGTIKKVVIFIGSVLLARTGEVCDQMSFTELIEYEV